MAEQKEVTWQRSCGNAKSKTGRELIYLETIVSCAFQCAWQKARLRLPQPKLRAHSEACMLSMEMMSPRKRKQTLIVISSAKSHWKNFPN
jgi:hypothetical protein